MAIKLLTEVVDFVEKEIGEVGNALKGGESELLKVATLASTVLNAAKTWSKSPVGATLLSIVEAIPGAGPIATEIVNTILPAAVNAVAVVEADASNPEALVTAGLTAIGAKSDADAVAAAYTSVSAIVTNKIAPLLKVASTIQAALSVTPSVYVPVKTA